jgi:hypothetical protein
MLKRVIALKRIIAANAALVGYGLFAILLFVIWWLNGHHT